MKVTVGVATCGRPDGLDRCLRALAAQTAPPAEVVVVDQAPSDAARAAVESSGLAAVRYLEQARIGLAASRNLALESARHDVLAVTDDDCVPDAGWLAAIETAFERSPHADAVTGPVLALGERPPGGHAISLRESMTPVDHAGRKVPWNVGTGANLAAPAALLRECGGWDVRLGTGSPGKAAEDADLLYRLLLHGAVVRYEPAAVVRHEWQTRERRLSTRWSYGYGVGAMCGLWLGRRDAFAIRMGAAYCRHHARELLRGVRHIDRSELAEHSRALAGVVPGLLYGLHASRRR